MNWLSEIDQECRRGEIDGEKSMECHQNAANKATTQQKKKLTSSERENKHTPSNFKIA